MTCIFSVYAEIPFLQDYKRGNLKKKFLSFSTHLFTLDDRTRNQLFVYFFRFLCGMFPNTMHMKDRLGRTPFHYAAICNDGNFIFKSHSIFFFGLQSYLISNCLFMFYNRRAIFRTLATIWS